MFNIYIYIFYFFIIDFSIFISFPWFLFHNVDSIFFIFFYFIVVGNNGYSLIYIYIYIGFSSYWSKAPEFAEDLCSFWMKKVQTVTSTTCRAILRSIQSEKEKDGLKTAFSMCSFELALPNSGEWQPSSLAKYVGSRKLNWVKVCKEVVSSKSYQLQALPNLNLFRHKSKYCFKDNCALQRNCWNEPIEFHSKLS